MGRAGSRVALVACAALAATGLATPAHATHYQDMAQVSVYAPSRVYPDVITLPMEEFERTRPPTRLRTGGHTHRIYWNNTLVGGYSVSMALKAMRNGGQRPSGVFADRPLTAAERRRFKEAVPLYDDADVMVVAAGHPACRGLTRAQARGIVSGRFTRWSQVVTGAKDDTIRLRYRGTRADPDLRFGATFVRQRNGRYRPSYPTSSRGAADGGIGAAAAGDHGIAAVTAWSRFRPQPGVCAVPLNGVGPSNATVTDRSYPEAFRVTYVVPRRTIRFGVDRFADRLLREFLASSKARTYLVRRGLLAVGRTPQDEPLPPATKPTVSAPATDHAGRPITTTPDANGEQAVIGLRLDAPTPEGRERLVFDANGALRRLTFDATGACVGDAPGGWTVKGAWRYAEHGGGLIARLGWFAGDGTDERVIDLPAAEPGTAYLDGAPYANDPNASTACGAPAR